MTTADNSDSVALERGRSMRTNCADARRSCTPKRIQLRRTKGWRKPDGAIVVARPTRWGNPLTMDGDKAAAALWFGVGLDMRRDGTLPAGHAFHCYPSDDEIRVELAGHDLACWCPLDEPCHADVLLEVAN